MVANGCTDNRASGRRYDMPARERGWTLTVLDLSEGSKINALNAGDLAAIGRYRVYLDADVCASQPLLGDLVAALATEAPRYATGTPRIPT